MRFWPFSKRESRSHGGTYTASPATICRAETDATGAMVYNAEGQLVFRQVQTTSGVHDLPSEDKPGLWLGDHSGGRRRYRDCHPHRANANPSGSFLPDPLERHPVPRP